MLRDLHSGSKRLRAYFFARVKETKIYVDFSASPPPPPPPPSINCARTRVNLMTIITYDYNATQILQH